MAYIKPRFINLNIIKKQVVRVEKLVGEKNKFKDVAFKKQRILNEKKRFEQKEKKLEDKGDSKEKQVSSKISVPKLGFLDVIKNFLFKVLLGAFVIKLLPHLPKLKGVLIGAMKFSDFILNFSGMLLNSFVTFVDKVYQVVDFGKQQAKLLGGDAGLKNYNRTLDLANKVMNSMFIAGMLFSDLLESDSRSNVQMEAVDVVKDRVVQQGAQRAAQQAAIRGAAQFGARAAAGTIAGVGLISSALGEGMFQLRKFTTKVERDAYAGLAEAQKDPNPFMRFLKVGFYNTIAIPGLRFYNFLSTGVGTLLDIIGAPFRYAVELINFGIMALTGDSEGIKNQRENLGKLDVRIREQLRQIVNTLSFGMLAKQQGSFGSLFGNQAVKSMGYASGGAVTRGGEYVGAVTRTVGKRVKAKRVVAIPTAPLHPGSDVGGLIPYEGSKVPKIQTFYPNPSDPQFLNSYEYLKSSYDIASDSKFLHPLLEISIKSLFGDKPAESDFKAVGVGMNNFINDMLDTIKIPGTDSVISDRTGPVDITNWASRLVKDSLMSPINSILSDLVNQLKLKKSTSSGEKESKPSSGGTSGGENPLAKFGGEAQFVIGDSIAHGFAGRSGNGSESEDTMVGRSSAAVLAILKVRGDVLKGALVDLSTGIANFTGDYTSVEEQLKYLKSIGARVRILGVANDYSKSKGGINEKLAQLASKYGFYFYGGYRGGKDKLHGTDEDYTNMKIKREKETAATPTANVSGSNNQQKAFNYFVSLGLSKEHAAGIVGNLMIESYTDIRPTADNGSHRGIAQWDKQYRWPALVKWAKSQGKNPDLFETQIEYLSIESGYLNKFKSYQVKDAGDAAIKWEKLFERSGGQANSQRISNANSVLNRYGGIKQAHDGGYIDKTQKVLTHPGEYVVDADSVKLFGIKFYDIINQVETISQRKNAANSLISILSQYTEDGFPETEEDNTYYVPEQSTVTVVPPSVILIGGGGFGMSGGGKDPSQDGLYM
jgi:hypothetical protein